jgi:hypothetical protein
MSTVTTEAGSAMGYTFRLPGRVVSKEMKARATFVLKAPELTSDPEGNVDVETELRALDAAGRVLNGKAPAARATSASANA